MSRVDALRQRRERMEAVRSADLRGRRRPVGRRAPRACRRTAAGRRRKCSTTSARAEGSLVKALAKFERGEPTRVPKRAWCYRLPMSPAFWNDQVPGAEARAPPPARRGQPDGGARELSRRRAATSSRSPTGWARSASRDRLPALPPRALRRRRLVRFLAGHEGRHLRQIRRVLAGPKVMRCASRPRTPERDQRSSDAAILTLAYAKNGAARTSIV